MIFLVKVVEVVVVLLLSKFVMRRSRSQVFVAMGESAGFSSSTLALSPEIANSSLE